MSKNDFDVDKAYVSPYDKFLAMFDAKHEPSASQRQEIKTHQRLAALRDGKGQAQTSADIWDKF